MTGLNPSQIAARAAAIALVLALLFGVAPATAAVRDRTRPTAPSDLRVTATTSYSVSLSWTPSTDNSGSFSYVICCGGTHSASVGQTATSFTFTAGLEAGRSYSFRMYAVDGSGNASKYSNTVSVTLPADTTPPTAPLVSVTEVGPTHVSLQWASTDDGPNVWYTVFQDGSPVIQGSPNTTGTISLLAPETTYTFTVQARDFGANVSPLSAPVSVTTGTRNSNDITPPTTPGNLSTQGMEFGEEIWLFWDQSTDDLDPQSLIRYDVYLNGLLNHSLAGAGGTILYGTAGMVNTFEVVAVDSAGNQSSPAILMIPIP